MTTIEEYKIGIKKYVDGMRDKTLSEAELDELAEELDRIWWRMTDEEIEQYNRETS